MIGDIGLAYPFPLWELMGLTIRRLRALQARANAHLARVYRAAA